MYVFKQRRRRRRLRYCVYTVELTSRTSDRRRGVKTGRVVRVY